MKLLKIVLLPWALLSFLKGAGLSFFVNGADQNIQLTFIWLAYSSMLFILPLSFWKESLAIVLLFLAALGAWTMILKCSFFTRASVSQKDLLISVAYRPFLCAAILVGGKVVGSIRRQPSR